MQGENSSRNWAAAGQSLLFLDSFQIVDDGFDVVGGELENGHIRVTGKDAFASDSARSLTGYLADKVRKGGASLCGLSPSRPTAWQRAQFFRTSTSPLSANVLSAATAGCTGNASKAMPAASRHRVFGSERNSKRPLLFGLWRQGKAGPLPRLPAGASFALT